MRGAIILVGPEYSPPARRLALSEMDGNHGKDPPGTGGENKSGESEQSDSIAGPPPFRM
jgi:hypothetical protein